MSTQTILVPCKFVRHETQIEVKADLKLSELRNDADFRAYLRVWLASEGLPTDMSGLSMSFEPAFPDESKPVSTWQKMRGSVVLRCPTEPTPAEVQVVSLQLTNNELWAKYEQSVKLANRVLDENERLHRETTTLVKHGTRMNESNKRMLEMLETSQASLDKALDTIVKRLGNLESRNKRLEQRLEMVETENKRLGAENKRLEERLETVETENKRLGAENKRLEERLETVETEN
eukprot:Colp12_sorted_trinity150504_noHs@20321